MMSLLAKRYSKALYELCSEQENLEAVHRDLLKVRTLIEESPEFSGFLKNPAISLTHTRAIFEEIFRKHLTSAAFNFIIFLRTKNRLAILKDICESFSELYDKSKGILNVKIKSSIALTKHQTDLLTGSLGNRFKKEIKSEASVDSKLIGGFKVQVDDTIFDYSIAAQLEKFKDDLLTA